MMDTASNCATVLHLVAFGVYAVAIYYTAFHLNIPVDNPKYKYGGKAKFFTYWNLVSVLRGRRQTLSFRCCEKADISLDCSFQQ